MPRIRSLPRRCGVPTCALATVVAPSSQGFVFVIGVAMLMTGAIIPIVPLSVAGFVVMLTSAWYAVMSWRRVPTNADGTPMPVAPAGTTKRARRDNRASFMQRMEERWRRRREDPGR